ncbi:MAG: TonB-dependent siderophore receptor [Tolypothrix brevis GSE-NOS-MK-07-07A]|jgi:iron complex outermembrane receptor protein|nr:TonB-dependent siderophore receptor [Tolypothrix brevis GSE-NOS-MK-07-07A]
MKIDKLFQSLLLTSAVVLLVGTPAKSEEVREDGIVQPSSQTIEKLIDDKFTVTNAQGKSPVSVPSFRKPRQFQSQIANLLSRVKSDKPINNIPQLSDVELPVTSAIMLVQQPTPTNTPATPGEVVSITGVKAKPTEKGVEMILETTAGDKLQVANRSTGNNFIADITGGQLRLANGEAFTFKSEKPLAGITEITVTNVDANTVRVTVVGEKALPVVELFDDDTGLVFAVASTETATKPPDTPPVEEKPVTEKPQEKPDDAIELVVTGEQDGYNVPNSSTATRTDTPIRDIPQSIQVVPQEVLRDQNVNSLDEALRNVTGVTSEFGAETFQGALYNIRGFTTLSRSGGGFLRNGLREGGDILQDFSPNVERVEALLGPASVLYGNANPGGTINVVTKQPLRDPFYAIDATVGNFDFYQGAIDLSGPLNDSKTVLYRLNVGYQDRGSFVDFLNTNIFTISPVVSVELGERTRLTVEGEYTKRSAVAYQGLPSVGTVRPNPNGEIPRNRFLGEPDGTINNTITRAGYRLEHQFSDNWSLQNSFSARIQRNRPGNDFYIIAEDGLADDNRTLNRQAITNDVDYDDYDLATYLTGKFSTGSIRHQLLVGIDLSSSFLRFERSSTIPTTIDVFNPVYRRVTGSSINAFDGDQLTRTLGIYVQDQVTLTENLKLLLGGRFDLFEQDFRFRSDTTSQSGDAFSPRIGIVYQPIKPISLYASYSRSFFPNRGTTFEGDPFQPDRGTQYEVGVKADLNDRLSATLALYDLTRSNVLTADPDNSGFSIQTGEQRSRGIELSVAGKILPGWNIIAGYAYTNAQVTEDNSIPVGNRLVNVPENSFNLWTSYEIQQGSLQGFGLGLGLFYGGERQGDFNNSFQIPSYLRTDAAIFYNRDRFRAAINVRNLFNVDYIEGGSFDNLFPGAPLTVQGTISWRF